MYGYIMVSGEAGLSFEAPMLRLLFPLQLPASLAAPAAAAAAAYQFWGANNAHLSATSAAQSEEAPRSTAPPTRQRRERERD
jgi:hypothetical protein